MQTKTNLYSLFLFLVLSLGAYAHGAELSLSNAKQQGLVGEQYDGYLGAVEPSPAPAVRSLVTEVNGKRRAEYERIAAANKIARTDVEALAGKKSIQKTASGNYVKPEGQGWRRK